jgi:predicted metal-dependent hydrolase
MKKLSGTIFSGSREAVRRMDASSNTRRVRDIEYQLLPGSPRKTTDIVIERNGVVTVRPPENYTPEQVDAVVESKRLWIYRNLAEWKDLNASSVAREWVNGETFLYLGRAYRLSLVSDQACALQLKEGRFCLSRSVIEGCGPEAARQAFETYFSDKGMQRFSERVAYFQPKVGVKIAGIKVKEMGYRWASCGKNGQLNFH